MDRGPAPDVPEQTVPARAEPTAGEERGRLELGLACCPGWRGELVLLAGFALLAILSTWPMVATLGAATGTRGDYLNNLWNAWWLEHALREGHTPFWTDYLYFPDGISLARHTLSPLNALALAGLAKLVAPHAAFSLLVLAHFTLSAWCGYLLARYVSGSLAGGVLGGVLYSFCPFHYFYLCQINVFSFEFVPLALLFALRYAREGGRASLVGAILALAGLAATIEYYVVYAYLALAVLALCARGWGGAVPLTQLWRRLALAGGLGALAVAAVAWPLLSGALSSAGTPAESATAPAEMIRFNDLYGFFWIGGPERSTVSWPTMLGYTTLLVLALGGRRVLAHWPWLVTGGVLWVLSLGRELAIGGHKTGVPLPYALFEHLPVLSLLRKSDRFFLVVQLASAVLLAAAWAGVSERLRTPRARTLAWCVALALLALELSGAPFERYEVRTSPGLAALRDDATVTAVMELPPEQRHLMNARTNYYQTLHGKKTTLGYTTSTALTPLHDQRLNALLNLHYQLVNGESERLVRLARELRVDRVVHYKSLLQKRPEEESIDGRTLWQPFCFVRRPLLRVRQVGEFVERPYPARIWAEIEARMTHAFGPPLYEDDFMAVFDAPKS
jgi:hypothetical protein